MRITVSAAALVVAALLLLAAPAGATVNGADGVTARLDGIPQHGRVLGSPNAPVTLTYFHELKCPFCRNFELHQLPTLIGREVRRGQLRIVAQPMAFIGDDSPGAARTALAFAQQNLYWNFIDLFYRNQQDETTVYATPDFLFGLASAVPGADPTAALAWAGTAPAEAALAKSERVAKRAHVNGTPTLYLSRTGRPMKSGEMLWRSTAKLVRREYHLVRRQKL